MERISIQELAAVLVTKSGLKKKEAERFATVMFDVVKEGLSSDRQVKIKGLGTFKVIDIDSRESVDVNTGERMVIEGHDKITFTPDATMKELVNKPFSQFETVVLADGVDFTGDEDEELEVDIENDMEPEPEPVEAPVLIEEPETVEEPVEEPAPEPEPESIEAPAPEPEPEAIEAPEPEPVQEEVIPLLDFIDSAEEQHSDEMPDEEEPEEEEEEDDEDEDEYSSSSGKRWIWWLLLSLIAFGAGFLLGRHTGKSASPAVIDAWTVDSIDKDTLAADTAKKDTLAADTAKKDTLAKPVVKQDTLAKPVADTPAKAKPDAKPDTIVPRPKPDDEKTKDAYKQYNFNDARVRTGAYRIIGTAQEVKVKKGETLKRISARHLGPDMECYVEAYNELKPGAMLKEGQTLKIPQLELKKKKKKQSNQ